MPLISSSTQSAQPIIDLILADINAVIPNLSSLVSSYRLLVGAAEEIHRTPEVCPDVFARAVKRFDNAGILIDIFLELLCCKIAFSSEFLKITCAPVDLFRLLANCTAGTDTPFHTAEQIVEMEALRRIIDRCKPRDSCLPDNPVVCPTPPAPPAGTSNAAPLPPSSDVQEVETAILLNKLNKLNKLTPRTASNEEKEEAARDTITEQETVQPEAVKELPPETIPLQTEPEPEPEIPIESRVRRKHLKDPYISYNKPKKRK